MNASSVPRQRAIPLPLKLMLAIAAVSIFFWATFRLGGAATSRQLHDVMAPMMFGGLIVFLIIGYPAAFSLAAVGMFFAIFGIQFGLFPKEFLGNLTFQLFSVISNDLLLAIPFFTFMGAILERCGLADDLLDSIGQIFGSIPGGLSYAVIIVGAILGAITGTVAASVIAMGVISLPVMTKYGYSPRHATGVIAASGTITQLIPPSLVLVVLADVMGKSVGDMYLGATWPSVIQLALFAAWVFILSIVRPQDVPPLPPEARTLRGKALAIKAAWGIVPSMVLIFLVLGTMALGLATPTEAGAMGAVGAIVLAMLRGTYSNDLIYQGMASTMRITAMVIMILIGSRVFSLVFNGVGGGEWIEGLLRNLPGGQTGFLVFTMVFIFIVAFFLDFFEIAFIIIPLLLPAATKLGIDPIWFGVLICANIQTSFMHPPFGFALFYLRGIAPPEIKSSDIYWGAVPWIVLQLILVGIIIAFPITVTHLLDRPSKADLSKVEIKIPTMGGVGGNSPFGNSPFGNSPFGAPPPFGGPPPIGGSAPPAPPSPFGGPPPGLTPPTTPVAPAPPVAPAATPPVLVAPPVIAPVEPAAPAATPVPMEAPKIDLPRAGDPAPALEATPKQ